MKRISFRSVLFSLSAAVAVVAASIIAVDSQTLPLGNESFHTYNFNTAGPQAPFSIDITTSCDASQQNGTVNYSLSGDATGPFAGTYSESGSYTIQNGVVTQFQASFTITPSGGGANITGTKSLGGPAGTFTGKCSSASTKVAEMTGVFNYTANVNGTNTSGAGDVALEAAKGVGQSATGFAFTNFHTASSNGVGDAKATGGGHILKENGSNGVHFGFNAQIQNNGSLHGRGTVHDKDTGTKIKILNVQSLVIVGTHATFTGQCEFNGAANTYVIDVDDIDEPAQGLDTFKIVVGSYTREGLLTGGNIQVRGTGAGTGTPTPSPTAPPD
jgi:hypothetical protein